MLHVLLSCNISPQHSRHFRGITKGLTVLYFLHRRLTPPPLFINSWLASSSLIALFMTHFPAPPAPLSLLSSTPPLAVTPCLCNVRWDALEPEHIGPSLSVSFPHTRARPMLSRARGGRRGLSALVSIHTRHRQWLTSCTYKHKDIMHVKRSITADGAVFLAGDVSLKKYPTPNKQVHYIISKWVFGGWFHIFLEPKSITHNLS